MSMPPSALRQAWWDANDEDGFDSVLDVGRHSP